MGDGSSETLGGGTDVLYADGSTNMQPVRTMSSRRANVEGIINLNVMGERLILNVDGLDEVTCQVECISGAFPASCILTQKYSNDGYRWDTITSAATVTADGATAAVNVTGYRLYALEVTDTNTGRAFVSINAKATS